MASLGDARARRNAELEELRKKHLTKSWRNLHGEDPKFSADILNPEIWLSKQKAMTEELRRKRTDAEESWHKYKADASPASNNRKSHVATPAHPADDSSPHVIKENRPHQDIADETAQMSTQSSLECLGKSEREEPNNCLLDSEDNSFIETDRRTFPSDEDAGDSEDIEQSIDNFDAELVRSDDNKTKSNAKETMIEPHDTQEDMKQSPLNSGIKEAENEVESLSNHQIMPTSDDDDVFKSNNQGIIIKEQYEIEEIERHQRANLQLNDDQQVASSLTDVTHSSNQRPTTEVTYIKAEQESKKLSAESSSVYDRNPLSLEIPSPTSQRAEIPLLPNDVCIHFSFRLITRKPVLPPYDNRFEVIFINAKNVIENTFGKMKHNVLVQLPSLSHVEQDFFYLAPDGTTRKTLCYFVHATVDVTMPKACPLNLLGIKSKALDALRLEVAGGNLAKQC